MLGRMSLIGAGGGRGGFALWFEGFKLVSSFGQHTCLLFDAGFTFQRARAAAVEEYRGFKIHESRMYRTPSLAGNWTPEEK